MTTSLKVGLAGYYYLLVATRVTLKLGEKAVYSISGNFAPGLLSRTSRRTHLVEHLVRPQIPLRTQLVAQLTEELDVICRFKCGRI